MATHSSALAWSLVGCRLWGHTEPDTTEGTWRQQLLAVEFSGEEHPFVDHCLGGAQGLVQSVKLAAVPCGTTQDSQLMVKSSDKTGPLEKEVAATLLFLPVEPHAQRKSN